MQDSTDHRTAGRATKVRPIGVRTDRPVRNFSKFLVFELFGARTVSSKWAVRPVRLFGLFINFWKFFCSLFRTAAVQNSRIANTCCSVFVGPRQQEQSIFSWSGRRFRTFRYIDPSYGPPWTGQAVQITLTSRWFRSCLKYFKYLEYSCYGILSIT